MRHAAPSGLVVLAVLGSILAACNLPSPQFPSTLQLEEHPLTAAPEPEPLSFQPVDGNQEAVLATHAGERAMGFQKTVTTLQGNPALTAIGEGSNLVAVLTTSDQTPPQQFVEVLLGDTPIFTTDAGLPSPVLPLQGLWAYDGHWALEILFADPNVWAGQVFVDGDLVNQRKGYDEAFGFQLLGGKPFFFYQRDGHVSYSYDGQETDLDYDQIPHYRCCGESALNPVQAENMVAFFAQRGEDWFYIELGSFDSG